MVSAREDSCMSYHALLCFLKQRPNLKIPSVAFFVGAKNMYTFFLVWSSNMNPYTYTLNKLIYLSRPGLSAYVLRIFLHLVTRSRFSGWSTVYSPIMDSSAATLSASTSL